MTGLPPGGEKEGFVRRHVTGALKWLVFSNLYLAIFGHAAMTASMMVLFRVPVNVVLLVIAFSGSMLIYSLNRYQDWQEDRINLPERSNFSTRYGRIITGASVPAFVVSLVFASCLNIAVLAVVLLPFVLGILYSHLRLKRIFLLKNLIISAGVSATLLVVVAVYPVAPRTWLPLYAILLCGILVNTIIFDIKDIPGDRFAGIRTLPVTLGERRTREICILLLAVMIFFSIPLLQGDRIFWALVPFFSYIGGYILFVPAGTSPWWFYGMVVDGEYLFLLVFALLLR